MNSPIEEAPQGNGGIDFCPYVGLAPFEADHADYYFGRDLAAATLADNVLVAPITVLYGASGVGKTSLLNVGLPKALEELNRDATLVLFRRWQGKQFQSFLFREIAKAAARPAADLHDAPKSLAAFVAWIVAQTGKSLILVFDQFEEYFVYQDGERARAFETELDTLAQHGDDVHVLIASREDRYHLLDRLRSTVSGILDNTLELKHLDDDAVRESIENPIQVYNALHHKKDGAILVAPGFVERLTRELKEVRTGRDTGVLKAPEAREIETSRCWTGIASRRSFKGTWTVSWAPWIWTTRQSARDCSTASSRRAGRRSP